MDAAACAHVLQQHAGQITKLIAGLDYLEGIIMRHIEAQQVGARTHTQARTPGLHVH